MKIMSHPRYVLFCLMALQVILWTVTPSLIFATAYQDIIESSLWGREWIIASDKHPALPSFLLALFHGLAGKTTAMAGYVVAQLAVILTFYGVYLLGIEILKNEQKALCATCLLTGSLYFSTFTTEFNHNIIQLPIWIWAMLALFHATQNNATLGWWLALGVLTALAAYAKYSALILYGVILFWLAYDIQARHILKHSYKPSMALLVALLGVMPLLLWLFDNSALPLEYARGQAAGKTDKLWFFLPAQIINHLPMLLILWLCGTYKLCNLDKLEKRDKDFLIIFCFAPLAVTFFLALITGTGLSSHWGIGMTSLFGIFALALMNWDKQNMRKMIALCFMALCITPLIYSFKNIPALKIHVSFTDIPSATLTQFMEEEWRMKTHNAPLKIVIGEAIDVAGVVAFYAEDEPSIFSQGSYKRAPWISKEQFKKEGALLVWRISKARPAYVRRLQDNHELTLYVKNFPYPALPQFAPLRIGYAIIPPSP